MLLKKLKILLLEDSPLDAELICREIKIARIVCDTHIVASKADYVKALADFYPDIILSDHTLPSFSSLEALQIATDKLAKIPFILVAGTVSEEFAVKVMKEGAWDYVSKAQLKRLPDAIVNAMDKYHCEKLRQNFLYDLILNEAYMEEAERIANYGSWEVDVISKKIKLSKEALNILGLIQGDTETLYDYILNNIHPDESQRVRTLIKSVTKKPHADVYKETFRLVDGDGAIRIVRLEFALKNNSQNKLSRINGSIHSVTDSLLMEDKVLESEERFRCLAENVSETAIFSLNAAGYITNSNKEAREVFDYTGDEINNRHISIIYQNQEMQNSELINHLKINNRSSRFETKSSFASKNGSRLSADTIINTLINKAGELSGFILVMRRITRSAFSAAVI